MRVLYTQKDALQTYLSSCQMNNLRVSSSPHALYENSYWTGFGYASVGLPIAHRTEEPVMLVLMYMDLVQVQPAEYDGFRRLTTPDSASRTPFSCRLPISLKVALP